MMILYEQCKLRPRGHPERSVILFRWQVIVKQVQRLAKLSVYPRVTLKNNHLILLLQFLQFLTLFLRDFSIVFRRIAKAGKFKKPNLSPFAIEKLPSFTASFQLAKLVFDGKVRITALAPESIRDNIGQLKTFGKTREVG